MVHHQMVKVKGACDSVQYGSHAESPCKPTVYKLIPLLWSVMYTAWCWVVLMPTPVAGGLLECCNAQLNQHVLQVYLRAKDEMAHVLTLHPNIITSRTSCSITD